MCRAPLLWTCTASCHALQPHTSYDDVTFRVPEMETCCVYILCFCCPLAGRIIVITLPLAVQPQNCSLIPGWGKRFFSSPKFPGWLPGLHIPLTKSCHFTLEVKWPGCEADCCRPLFTTEVKSEWSQPSWHSQRH